MRPSRLCWRKPKRFGGSSAPAIVPSGSGDGRRTMSFIGKIAKSAAIGAVALTLAAAAQAQTTLRVVAHSDLKILDPIWTTAYITRNHGYLIYDTLLGQDEKQTIRPQMAEKWTASDDKLTFTFT